MCEQMECRERVLIEVQDAIGQWFAKHRDEITWPEVQEVIDALRCRT